MSKNPAKFGSPLYVMLDDLIVLNYFKLFEHPGANTSVTFHSAMEILTPGPVFCL